MKKEKSEMFECEWCGHEFQIDLIRYEYVTELENKLSETEEKLKEAYKSIIGMVHNSCCRSYSKSFHHSNDCIVVIAEKWLEDKE